MHDNLNCSTYSTNQDSEYLNLDAKVSENMLCYLTLIPHLAENMILHKNDLPNLGENLRSNLVQAAKILYNIGMKLHLFWWLCVPYNSCRTTRSCIIGPYHQGCGLDSIEAAAVSEAAHCRIRFGRRPAYVRSWPKAKLACAIPKSRELGWIVE